MTTPIHNPADHFAEAEQILAELRRNPGREMRDRLIAIAQVHATLATRQEPAGHPVTPYREALAELREAVQEYIVDRDAHTPPGLRDAPPLARLRELLGRPS